MATLSLSMKPMLMNSLKHTKRQILVGRPLKLKACKVDRGRCSLCMRRWREFPAFVTEYTCEHFKPRKTSQIQFDQAFPGNSKAKAVCLSGRCIDLSKLLLAFLTWLLLSDLPLHRFPDVCRLRALTCRLGNHFLFRQSWRRWYSQCLPGKLNSPPGTQNRLSGYRDQHTWRQNSIYLPTFVKHTYFNYWTAAW